MKKFLTIIFYIAFIIFFIILLKSFDYGLFYKYFKEIKPIYWLVIFILFFLTYLAKAYRFYKLNNEISFSRLMFVTISHNFFLFLLPLRLGEIAYVKQLKKHGITITKSVIDLIIVRIYDFIILAILFFFLLVFGIQDLTLSVFSISIVIVLLAFSYYFVFHTRHLYNILTSLSKKIKYFPASKKTILEILEHNVVLKTSSKLRLLTTSFFVWFFSGFNANNRVVFGGWFWRTNY